MKILMAGLGGIGQRHVRNLRTLLGSDVEILAYRTRGQTHVLTDKLTIEPGADLASRYDVRVFDQLAPALAQRPDMVFITNPSSLHIDTATAAAEAGCHLFIEKPLSHSWDGIDRLLEVVDKRRLVTLLGYQLRFHPSLRFVKELLDGDRVGAPLAVRMEVGEYLPGFHRYEDYRQMYASRRDLGGGVILSQIHELDIAYWFFGMPRRLFAVGGHFSDLEIDVEDVASLLLECQRDGRPLPVHVHQDYVQRPPSRRIEIVCSRGKVSVDLHALEVKVDHAETGACDRHSFARFERNQMFLDEVKHFLACVRGEEKPIVSLRDGAQSLRIALAAHESIARGQVIDL